MLFAIPLLLAAGPAQRFEFSEPHMGTLVRLVLYAPDAGYYERKKEIGRGGDFYTSVSVGPLFGELLAFQFAEWLDTSWGTT